VSVTHGNFTKNQRWLFPVACLVAVVIVATLVPFASLWRQQRELGASSAAIAQLQQEQKSLNQQAEAASNRASEIALAREQYQLVLPKQSLIQILPGAASGYISSNSGDPGNQPLVSPVNPPSTGLTPSITTRGAPSNGFFSRFLHVLEFWR
jgi:hypothetical protein